MEICKHNVTIIIVLNKKKLKFLLRKSIGLAKVPKQLRSEGLDEGARDKEKVR
jgi:hypothetical protein